MTPLRESFENSSLVETWLKEPTWLEPVDEGRVATIVHQTPQVRRWPPQVDLGRFAPMLNATKFVAASVILALTGSLLFNVLPTEPTPAEPIPAAETATAAATATPTAEATTETATEQPVLTTDSELPIITLPDELPDGVESGTIDTPIGPARWVHLTGEPRSLPGEWFQLLPWKDGILAWQGYSGQLLTTDDGVTWTKVDTDQLHGEMVAAGDEWYVVSGSRVRTASDPTGEWTELDASALAEARLSGWKVDGPSVVSMVVDGRIVFGASYRYSLPKRKLNISMSGTKNLRALPDGRYVLCSSGDRADCSPDARWVLRIKETPEGLVVRHDRTGKRLGLIEGATADQIYRGEHGTYRRLFAIEDDEIVEIDSPWPGLSPWQVANRVVAPGGTEPVLQRWRSDGKVGPSTPGVPSFVAEIPKGSLVTVVPSPDRLAAQAWNGRGNIVGAWVSADGVDWTPAPTGAPDGAEVRWSGATWLATSEDGQARKHWLNIGGEWVALDGMGLDRSGWPVGIGNTTLIPGWNDNVEELWVLTHPVGTQ